MGARLPDAGAQLPRRPDLHLLITSPARAAGLLPAARRRGACPVPARLSLRCFRPAFRALLLLLLFLPLPAAAGPAVRIGLIADQTGTEDLDQAYRMLRAGVETLRHQRLDGLIHLGDLVESGRPASRVQADFAAAAPSSTGPGWPGGSFPATTISTRPCRCRMQRTAAGETLFRALAAPHLPGLAPLQQLRCARRPASS